MSIWNRLRPAPAHCCTAAAGSWLGAGVATPRTDPLLAPVAVATGNAAARTSENAKRIFPWGKTRAPAPVAVPPVQESSPTRDVSRNVTGTFARSRLRPPAPTKLPEQRPGARTCWVTVRGLFVSAGWNWTAPEKSQRPLNVLNRGGVGRCAPEYDVSPKAMIVPGPSIREVSGPAGIRGDGGPPPVTTYTARPTMLTPPNVSGGPRGSLVRIAPPAAFRAVLKPC